MVGAIRLKKFVYVAQRFDFIDDQMWIVFVCIFTHAYAYVFLKIDIMFMLISFVMFTDTFNSLRIDTMASVQKSSSVCIDK